MTCYYCLGFRAVHSCLQSNQRRVYWLLIDYKWRFDWSSLCLSRPHLEFAFSTFSPPLSRNPCVRFSHRVNFSNDRVRSLAYSFRVFNPRFLRFSGAGIILANTLLVAPCTPMKLARYIVRDRQTFGFLVVGFRATGKEWRDWGLWGRWWMVSWNYLVVFRRTRFAYPIIKRLNVLVILRDFIYLYWVSRSLVISIDCINWKWRKLTLQTLFFLFDLPWNLHLFIPLARNK